MLISVNPFKQMPYFTDREIELYQGAVSEAAGGNSGLIPCKTPRGVPGGSPSSTAPWLLQGSVLQIHIPGKLSSEMHTKATQTW